MKRNVIKDNVIVLILHDAKLILKITKLARLYVRRENLIILQKIIIIVTNGTNNSNKL